MYVRSTKLAILGAIALASLLFFNAATVVNAQSAGPGSNVGPQTNAATPTGALLADGIFGCSANKYQNPGSLVAVGGVYVPVNDAAVTLNTGYLVYKECVLDGVVSAIRNDAVAGLQRQVLRSIQTSREGGKQFVENIPRELNQRRLEITVARLSGESLNTMCPAFRRPVQNVIARGALTGVNAPDQVYTCPAELSSGQGGGSSYGAWFAAGRPEGNILGATALVAERIRQDITADERNLRDMWSWSGGFYPAFDSNQDPLARRVITPGSLIASSLQQWLGAGTSILVNANEIDQINGALQAGLSATIVSDTVRGLTGLTQSQNGQPSYLDRMAAEASASVRQGAVNAALSILSAARQIESLYRAAKEGVATALTEAILKLRDAERQCWDLIIPSVQSYASSQGATIRVATSTAFSQQIIDTQIALLATTTINELRASEESLALINQLITSVTNSSSAAVQRAALERLDTMVANNQLHTAQDAQNAQKQKDDVTAALGLLLTDTVQAWADSTDPNTGWCNVNSQATIDRWFNEWRQ